MLRLVRTAAVLSALLVSAGCTALARFEAPDIEGTPDATGVVVVEADITVIAAWLGIRSGANPVGGLLVQLDGPKSLVSAGKAAGYVIFVDLAPGRWQLVMVAADWPTGNGSMRLDYGMTVESADAFTFDVRAGQAIYVGAEIDDDRRFDSPGVRYRRRDDPENEREAWEWMSEIYAESPWEPVFRSKAAPSSPGPASAPAKGI